MARTRMILRVLIRRGGAQFLLPRKVSCPEVKRLSPNSAGYIGIHCTHLLVDGDMERPTLKILPKDSFSTYWNIGL